MSESRLLLDVFAGAGGASMGYHRAGWTVVGVDKEPQPNYPFRFIRADALDYLSDGVSWLYDAIHAGPPCQRYSVMSACRPGLSDKYPDLIEPTRELLESTGLPWVMENVPGSPLRNPVTLCGTMFGYELYRHRLFESNVPIAEPLHPVHVKPASKAGHWTPGTIMSISGHVSPIKMAREIMDIDWTTRDELAEAIPPYYTHYIGRELMRAVSP